MFIFIPFGILIVLELINMVKEAKRKELERLMLEQFDELKKINQKSEKSSMIENTICLQLEELKSAKRDFKKINELEKTFGIPFEEIVDGIEELKKDTKKKTKKEKVDLEKTIILYDSDDIMKEIN